MLHCCYAAAKTCWTSEQDMQLLNSIQKHGTSSWSTIAAEVTGKINKQCRERYMCHLDPIIDKTPLSDAEISTLEPITPTRSGSLNMNRSKRIDVTFLPVKQV